MQSEDFSTQELKEFYYFLNKISNFEKISQIQSDSIIFILWGSIFIIASVSETFLNLTTGSKSTIFIWITAIFFGGLLTITIENQTTFLSNKCSLAYGIKRAAQGKGTFIGAFIGFFILLKFSPDIPLMYIAIPIFGLANFYASLKYFRVVTSEKLELTPNLVNTNVETNLKQKSFPILLAIGTILILFSVLIESVTSAVYIPYVIPFLKIYINIYNNGSIHLNWKRM